MPYSATVRNERFVFPDLRDLLAKANEEKSGDQLAGIGARSERERVAAKLALADVPLSEIVARPLIDDDVTGLIHQTHDRVVVDVHDAVVELGTEADEGRVDDVREEEEEHRDAGDAVERPGPLARTPAIDGAHALRNSHRSNSSVLRRRYRASRGSL